MLPIFRAPEVSRLSGFSVGTVYSKASKGEIPSMKVASSRLFEQKQVLSLHGANYKYEFPEEVMTPFDRVDRDAFVFPEEVTQPELK